MSDPYAQPPNHPPDHVAPEVPPRGARVSLREVTQENVRTVCDLRTTPAQRKLVGPAAYTLAESAFEPGLISVVYADEVVVGLSCVDLATSTPYLVRFLVDAGAQGRGFGAAAVELLCDHFREEGSIGLEVTFVPVDGGAQGFWERLGFVDTGRTRDGEPVYIRTL